jgi:hypothetical protein
LRYCGKKTKNLLRDTPNLFSIAKEKGLTTAVVGWHLPYCQAFSRYLDFCSRYPLYHKGNRKQESNVFAAATQLVRDVATIRKSSPIAHFDHMQEITEEAVRIAADKNYSFTLLHLPMPHEPYLYDSQQEKFVLRSDRQLGYQDNLMLMDKTLGRIQLEMKKAGLWDDTLVILTSDHSASRIKLNEKGERVLVLSDHSRQIVPQENELSLNTRVPLLIKFPSQSEPVHYSGKTNSILVYDFIKSIWNEEIKSPDQLAQWMESNSSKSEKATDCFRRFKAPGNLP